VHDFLTVGAAAPLQEAGALALALPDSYYERVAASYLTKRDFTVDMLTKAGLRCFVPRGAYYIMTDISAFKYPDDVSFSRYLVEEIGVAVVPGSSFFNKAVDGHGLVRFTFCKKESTLQAASERLAKLRPR
jgi:aminotransferase